MLRPTGDPDARSPSALAQAASAVKAVLSKTEHTPHIQARGIAIVAFGKTRELAPWDSDEWYKWSLNDSYAHFARKLARLFEMHPPEHYNTDGLYVQDHERRLAEIAEKIDVILAVPNPRIPKGKLYPIDQVIGYFGRDYFRSTIPYMICLAIMDIQHSREVRDNFYLPKLGLWGLDMELTSEYAKERACVEYWLGRAESLGIELVIPDESPLLKSLYRYGYQAAQVDKRRKLIEGRQRDLQNAFETQNATMEDWRRRSYETKGALHETAWWLSEFTDAEHAGEAQS